MIENISPELLFILLVDEACPAVRPLLAYDPPGISSLASSARLDWGPSGVFIMSLKSGTTP